MTVENIRNQFPGLNRKVYGKDLVYLDNAATSQRPRSVIDKWNNLAINSNANIHRAVHCLADEATAEYEAARDSVQKFINAACRQEIIFTSGCTAASNLVAYSFFEAFVKEGDEVVVTEDSHHSNIVPWKLACDRKGAVMKVVGVLDDGRLDTERLENALNERTKLVAVTHISNVLGLVNPIKEIVDICHAKGAMVFVDGAQGIVHQRVDVQDLDCDFYAFSGHKVYASTGVGVLYGKKELLEKMPPFLSGGEMVGNVSFEEITFAPLPLKFEAGTQNFNSVPTLIPALDMAKIMLSEEIEDEQEKVKRCVYDNLLNDNRITLFGTPYETKVPLFSFVVKGVHHEDLAILMDKMGVALRSGQMCAEPLMTRFGVTGMLRASFAPYNTMAEAEYFVKCLDRAIKMLQ